MFSRNVIRILLYINESRHINVSTYFFMSTGTTALPAQMFFGLPKSPRKMDN